MTITTPWCNAPTHDNNDKLHPVVSINYVPRIIASAFYLLISISILGEALFSYQYFSLIFLGLLWPHIAWIISTRAKHGKRQEILNMHFDALFSAAFCLVSPASYFISVVLAVLCANALFIGFFRLLTSTISVFAVTMLTGLLYLQPDKFLTLNQQSQMLTTFFMVVYFSSFGAIGYRLTRKMIQLNKQVESLSVTDSLTNSHNRFYLEKNLTKELHRCYRVKYPLTLIFADLDHFKNINDQYGHGVGDEILKSFVEIAKNSIRDDVDWIARYGGEEFVIVLPNSNAENGSRVAERIRTSLDAQNFQIEGNQIHVTCSFGVSAVNNEDQNTKAETLLAQADNGLYKAKANGRNRVEIVSKNNTSAANSNFVEKTSTICEA